MSEQTKENTLYLPIKQIYFDQIIAGTKTKEFREVKSTTANKYLIRDGLGNYIANPACTEEDEDYFIDDFNNGNFPFLPKQYKFIDLAVGYAKERDTATVEVKSISYEHDRVRGTGEKKFTFWIQVFNLGKVTKIHRKNS